jgi:hypothetical protein
MKTFLQRNIILFGQTVLAMTALAAFLLLGAAPRAKADNDNCQHRIANADHKLHVAAEKHGWNSSQAAHARAQLHEAREHCWSTYHKWWDEDSHRWHTEHDWDDHDHDDRH